jgi:hypothetical protein
MSLTVLAGCTTIDKLIKRGRYDDAINKLEVKLKKHPGKKKLNRKMEQAFYLANGEDLNAIRSLKLSGQPDIWHKVYDLYRMLDYRQQKIALLPEESKKTMQFHPEDYSMALANTRDKACAYYYALAKKLLSSGNLNDQPHAFGYLTEINKLNPEYKDVSELLSNFEKVQPVYIYYKIIQKYSNSLSPMMESALAAIDLSKYDMAGYRFLAHKPRQRGAYRYYAEIKILDILISPEKTEEVSYTESADIQDGVAYQVDSNGSFVLDSLGNKIELPKYKTVACNVTEYTRHKSMLIAGTVEVTERASGKKIAVKDVVGETKFNNHWAKFDGDLSALSDETYKLVGTHKADYPTDFAMFKKALEKFNVNVTAVIADAIEKQGTKNTEKK